MTEFLLDLIEARENKIGKLEDKLVKRGENRDYLSQLYLNYVGQANNLLEYYRKLNEYISHLGEKLKVGRIESVYEM